MRNVLFSTVALVAMTTAALAEQDSAVMPYGPILSGEVALDFAENSAGDYAGTMGIDLGINATGLATVDLDFEVDEDGNGSLADWDSWNNRRRTRRSVWYRQWRNARCRR